MNEASRAAVAAVLDRHEAELLSIPGVVGAGVGWAADHGGPDVACLVVLAVSAIAPDALPATLEGVPVFVVITGLPRQQGP